MEKPIRIFNVPWHIAHQYELYKIPNTEWAHCMNSVRRWGVYSPKKDGTVKTTGVYRPLPDNVTEVPHYEPGKYDLALIHIDQQCIEEDMGKGRLYRDLNKSITDIPKIVIQHGTPYWPERYTTQYIRMKMRPLIGDNFVVYNSHRAQEMWGDMGSGSQTIIHGMDPDEWWDLPKEPRSVTMLSPGGLDRYYNRALLQAVKDILKQRGLPHCQITVDWEARDFDDYRNFLGRSLVYFNPTLESPMPRSRTEAMLSGCCVITTKHHGADKFIEQGKNGFLVPDNDPTLIADLIQELVENNYKKAIEIGQNGKQTAMKIFSKERYQKEWLDLIHKTIKR